MSKRNRTDDSENVLKKAQKHFRRGHFSQVCALLEPEIFNFRENFTFYKLLGLSSLFTGDQGAADTYLQRSVQLNRADRDCQLGLAALFLKKRNTQKALQIWLDLLERDPRCVQAKRGLAAMRRHGDPEEIAPWLESPQFKTILPRVPRPFPISGLLLVLGGLALLSLAVYWLPGFLAPWFENANLSSTEKRPGAQEITITDLGPMTSFEGRYSFLLSEVQVKETFELGRRYFQNYQDNLAMREMNRLLLSNASDRVKDRVRTLRGLIQKPDFVQFKENFLYREVRETPPLYENCFVKWKGAIANLKNDKNEITFDFLIGYDEGRILEGIVPVTLHFPILLQNAMALEVLGEIRLAEKSWYIEGLSIHELGYRTNP